MDIKEIISISKESFARLKRNNPLRLAAATAFFTLFSLPPILLILTTVLGIIFKSEEISTKLLTRLEEVIGAEAASLLESIFTNIAQMGDSWFVTIASGLFFMFVATTLFVVIQDSLNQLWGVKQRPKRHIVRKVVDRTIALGMILFGGLLFLISLILDSVVTFLGKYLEQFITGFNLPLAQGLGQLVAFGVSVIWIAILFKYLPAVNIKWKVVWTGAIVTSMLYMIGKIIIGQILLNSNITSIYGASGSLVLLLLFVFYFSLILYFGASFTISFSGHLGKIVRPKSYAVKYRINEITES